MYAFDQEVWDLHRKLFHRLVKYRKYLQKATETLPSYKDDTEAETMRTPDPKTSMTGANDESPHIISLLSSDSEAVSAGEDEEEEEENEKEEEIPDVVWFVQLEMEEWLMNMPFIC